MRLAASQHCLMAVQEEVVLSPYSVSGPYPRCACRRFNFDVRKGPVKIEWFVGAETNLSYNCLDRHVEAGHGERVAFYWEGNDLNEDCKITYSQLLEQACGSHQPCILCVLSHVCIL